MPDALSILRDRQTGVADFRAASLEVTGGLIQNLYQKFVPKRIEPADVTFVIILRAALAFLPAITQHFPSSPIAFAGIRRDEADASPHWYYENFQSISPERTIVIVDPMLATGGSASEAAKKVLSLGADARNVHYVGVLAAPEGFAALANCIPKANITVAAMDQGLDTKKFIVPGLGDYGDRYFG